MHNSPTLATDVVMRLDSPELNDNSLIWSLLSRQIGPLYGLLRSLAINKKFENCCVFIFSMIAQRIRSATGLPITICDIAEKYIFHERAYEHINIFLQNVFENKVCSLCYEKFDSNRHKKQFCAFCDREPVCWSCMGDYCDAQKCMLFACVDCLVVC